MDQIDATKLRRVALLGAAAGYVYASVTPQQLTTLEPFLTARAEARLAQAFEKAQWLAENSELEAGAAWYESRNLMDQTLRREIAMLHSLVEFTAAPADADAQGAKALADEAASFQNLLDANAKLRGAKGSAPAAPWSGEADAKAIPERVSPGTEFGPLTYQNDDVLLARLGKERYGKIKLHNELYAYEIVNFVNGKRSFGEIRDAVSAEYGPLPLNLVADYLEACAEAGVIRIKR